MIKRILILLFILLASCKTQEVQECNINLYDGITLEWGYYISKLNKSEYFSLSNNQIINHNLNINNNTNILSQIKISKNLNCYILSKATNLFLKTQTLNVPADSNHFMIYRNHNSGVELRFLWNPLHTNKGNQEFKELYQEFNNLIIEKESQK
jgi:hypothetical protein